MRHNIKISIGGLAQIANTNHVGRSRNLAQMLFFAMGKVYILFTLI